MNWYIKHPETKLRSDYYLQPFDRNLWLAFIFSVIVVNIFIVIVVQNFVDEKHNGRGLIDDLLIGLETFCNQNGISFDYKNISLKILYMLLRNISYIALVSFGAVITSFLAVEIPKIPFQTVDEFVQNGKYQLLVLNASYVHLYLLVGNLFLFSFPL